MPFLNIFAAAWNALTSSTNQPGSIDGLILWIINLVTLINDWINAFVSSGTEINDWWTHNAYIGSQVQKYEGNAQLNNNAIAERIVHVIIPHSVRGGITKYVEPSIHYQQSEIQKVMAENRIQTKQISNLWAHFKQYTDPAVDRWLSWDAWWNKVGSVDWRILDDWIKAPGLLSAKLTPTITPDIAHQLNTKAGRTPSEFVLAALIKVAPAMVKQLDAGMVRVLTSGRY